MAKKKKNKSSSIKDIDKVIDNEIVNNVNLDDEFAESFISYSIMTILDRAIPQIDGMKPSQRRVLYDMYTLKNVFARFEMRTNNTSTRTTTFFSLYRFLINAFPIYSTPNII